MAALSLILGLALAGCATTGPGAGAHLAARPSAPASSEDVPVSAGVSPYGYFLAAQAAESYGQTDAAATLYDHAAALGAPAAEPYLKGEAFIAEILAGDIARAALDAPQGADADPDLVKLGALVRGVQDLAESKGAAARVELRDSEGGAATRTAAALLLPFAAAEAGDVEGSVAQPIIPGAPVAQFFARLDQGILFEHAHRTEEAETSYRELLTKGDPAGLATLALGALLERRGRQADAIRAYDAALAKTPGDPALIAARARAAAHRPAPPLPTLRRAAAEALIAPAGVMVTQKSDDVAMAYLRLALRLDPTRDEAWILVGDVLAAEGDTAAAHAAYARPGPNSPNYVEGQLKLAWAEQEAGNTDKALARVRALAGAHPHDREVAISLADILRAGGRYPDSIKLLDTLISTEGEVQDWRLLYMRADDEQESGDWPAAERDLKRALILQPNEPELLNFLGYSWIDRGERLNEALDMIKRAVALDPHSGAMIDSLGWGYYRLGDYAEAVKQLEAAVLLEPGDPDINDHLGDAYWRAGRKLEAQFQWRRVLSLDPSAKLKAQAEAKLKDGLGEPSAAPLKTSDPRPSVVAVTRQTPS